MLVVFIPLKIIKNVGILHFFLRRDDDPRRSNQIGEDEGLKQKKQIKQEETC